MGVISAETQDGRRGFLGCRVVEKGSVMKESTPSADGLVGYDTALTRRGSRVQFPLCVMVLFFFILSRIIIIN